MKRRHQEGRQAWERMEWRPESTMLDLVQAVTRLTDSEAEVLRTVTALVNSGRVRLIGNFRGATIA